MARRELRILEATPGNALLTSDRKGVTLDGFGVEVEGKVVTLRDDGIIVLEANVQSSNVKAYRPLADMRYTWLEAALDTSVMIAFGTTKRVHLYAQAEGNKVWVRLEVNGAVVSIETWG